MSNPSVWIMLLGTLGGFLLTRLAVDDGHRRKIPQIPSSKNAELKIQVTACDPDGDRWLWKTYFVLGLDYSFLEHDDYRASGIVNDESKAWERAREAADDARARYAAEMMRQSKGRVETLPL